MTDSIEKLYGVNNIEVNTEKGKLYIEKKKNDGIEIDLNTHELMHLLAEFTDKDIHVLEDIYGATNSYNGDTE